MTENRSKRLPKGKQPRITWDPVIRKETQKLRIAKQRNLSCSFPGCNSLVEFECAYSYRREDGKVARACLLYCENHTRRFGQEHDLDLCLRFLTKDSKAETEVSLFDKEE
jgi:hypothetical protein